MAHIVSFNTGIDLASKANAGKESAIHDAAREILQLIGYEERGTLLRSHYAVRDGPIAYLRSTILLIVQEDKTAISANNPEAQVIAEAIAAFQSNNLIRSRLGQPELDIITIPCITMVGTRPIFCKVPVTSQLNEAVITGKYPTQRTLVTKCVVSSQSRRLSEGMETPDFRKLALQHYIAFRALAKECWSAWML